MRTLRAHLAQSGASESVQQVVLTIAHICAEISALVGRGALAGIRGEAGSGNVQGERQQKLDVIANDLFIQHLSRSKSICGLASEEMDHAIDVPGGAPLLVAFDPLDGSSNIDVNVSIGSIFSVLPAPSFIASQDPSTAPLGKPVQDRDFLLPGHQQLASGYAIYGPSTELVITSGNGVYSFTLDAESRDWFETRGPIRIPQETQEFAINASNARHWYPGVQRYIGDLIAGSNGPRGKDFNMRWIASMVADVHRILYRGGIFLYPPDARDPSKPGKLRLLYEANPIAKLIEQAGGAASTGEIEILLLQPDTLHQRVGVVLGSREEVLRATHP